MGSEGEGEVLLDEEGDVHLGEEAAPASRVLCVGANRRPINEGGPFALDRSESPNEAQIEIQPNSDST